MRLMGGAIKPITSDEDQAYKKELKKLKFKTEEMIDQTDWIFEKNISLEKMRNLKKMFQNQTIFFN
jgi:hypothetical protein